jgi:DNA replication and repair protein RecF
MPSTVGDDCGFFALPSPHVTKIAVRKISLTNFRCYDRATLESDDRSVVLTGPNGAGKTNLLEAISFLAPGRGIRRAQLNDIDRRTRNADATETGWAISATVGTPFGKIEIGTGRETGNERRRRIRINGADANNQIALAEYVSAVWLTPQMDRLFLEGAAARRRFFDRLVFGFDPAHAGRISAYEHAMRERMKLLRNSNSDDIWLSRLEQTMAERGVAIAAARRELAARLEKASVFVQGPFPVATIASVGILENWLDGMPALDAEQRFAEMLKSNRRVDGERGKTTCGPHRSDFCVTHQEKNLPAEQCSTGEQKALLIAIILADTRLQAKEQNRTPLLLLDEVVAHLDEVRRRALFDEIHLLGAQAWLTGTDVALFEPFGDSAQYVAVSDATLSQTQNMSAA